MYFQACMIAIFCTYLLVTLYLEQDIFLSVQKTERPLFIKCHCTRCIWQPADFQPCKVVVLSSTSVHQAKSHSSLAICCCSTIPPVLQTEVYHMQQWNIHIVFGDLFFKNHWIQHNIRIWWKINEILYLSTRILQASQFNAWRAVMKLKFHYSKSFW